MLLPTRTFLGASTRALHWSGSNVVIRYNIVMCFCVYVLVLSRDVQLSTAVDNCILPFPFEKTGGETMSIITYENITLKAPKLTQYITTLSWKDRMPIMFVPDCYRCNCYIEDTCLGYVLVQRINDSDVYWVRYFGVASYLSDVVAAVRYWLFTDMDINSFLWRLPTVVADSAVSDLLDAFYVSKSKAESIVWFKRGEAFGGCLI